MELHHDADTEKTDDTAHEEMRRDQLRLKELLLEKEKIESISHQGSRDASSRNRLCEEIAALDDKIRREAQIIADGPHL